jgi:hypothetical protein
LNATDVNGSLTRRRLVLYLEVSAAHGVPLASEEVDYKLVYADGAFSSGSGRTDERGELRVEGSPAAPGSALHLCHQRHSCAEIPVDAPEGGVVDLGRVVLEGLANPTLVTILDSRGRPVAGADVTVAGRRFVTDRDGKFLFGAELGDYTASVRVAGLLSRGFSVDGSGEAVVALGHDFASFWIRAQRGDGRDLLAPVHLWLWPESGRRQVWGVEGVEGLEGAANVIGVEPADLGGPILITCVTGDDVFGKVTRLDEMRLSIAHDGVVTYWTTLERWDVGSVAFSAGNPWPVAVASRWEDVLLKRGAPEALRDFLEASGRSPLWSRSRREYFVVRFPFVEDGVVAIVCADRSDWSHELRYRDLLDLAGNRVPLSRQE